MNNNNSLLWLLSPCVHYQCNHFYMGLCTVTVCTNLYVFVMTCIRKEVYVYKQGTFTEHAVNRICSFASGII